MHTQTPKSIGHYHEHIGFLSAHLVGQINVVLRRAHRHGFTLDVITVEDIAESADLNFSKA